MVDYGPLYQAAGDQYGIDPLLLQTLAGKESNQDPNAVGPMITQGPAAGQHALGLMQFIPQTAAQYDVAYPMSPVQSTYGAANYMDTLLKKHDGNLRAALAEYSGNGSNVNAPYVRDVMDRYTGLTRAWAASGSSAAGPTTDTDPDSPTTGSATYANLQRPSGPSDLTTAKGNPGQPAPSVPTTDKGGVSYTTSPSTTFAPPGQGGPKGQRTDAAPTPDYLHDAPAPGAAPAAPATPAVSSGPDYLHDAPQQVDADGNPIKPMDTGQYLTSATSPGAKSVGSSAEISEGREPGPAVQAAINLATDPAQQARIAAAQLKIPLDRIVIGEGGRLAAVDEQGQRYYIQPPPVFNPQTGFTKAPRASIWPTQGNEDWHPIGAAQVTPYSRAAPLGPGATAANIPLAMGGAIPGTVQNYLTMAPAAIGGPVTGAVLTGVASQLAQSGRQWLANRFDPDQAQAPSPAPTSESLRNALAAAGGTFGLRVGGALLAPEIAAYSAKGEPGAPSTALKTGIGSEVPLQFPLGEAGGARAPWENPLVRPTETPMPGGPAEPVPLPTTEVPSAEVAGVPQVKTDAQIAAEDRAIPTDAPTLRFPLVTDAAIKQQAKDVLHWYAQNGNIMPEPGVEGTLPQLTENRGIAALLRGLRDRAGPVANEIGQVEEAQAAANRATIANLRGDEDQLTSLRQARTQQTADLEAKAVANKSPTNPSDVQDAVVKQLNSRAAQDPQVADALRDVYERLYQHDPLTGNRILDEAGNPQLQTDPEQLMGLRQSIAREMTRGAQSNRPDMRLASGQLSPVLDQLDAAITRGMPHYPEFNAAYREASKPITAMEYLQGRNMVDTATQTPMLSAVQRTLDDIYKQRVLAHGWQPAQDLSQDQIDQLTGLRDQLRREYNLRRGMSIGPATFEKFTTSQMTNALMSPLMRYGRGIAAAGLGAHEFGLGGYALGLGEAGIEALAARRQMAVQQKFYSELAKLLLNRNGEGVAALREAPGGSPPNALTGP